MTHDRQPEFPAVRPQFPTACGILVAAHPFILHCAAVKRMLTPLFLGWGLAVSLLHAQDPSLQTSGTAAPGQASGNPRNAIIVIRHAEDTENWVWEKAAAKSAGNPPFPSEYWSSQAPEWPEYLHDFRVIGNTGNSRELNPDGFVIAAHALSGDWKSAQGKDGTVMKVPTSPQGESQARRLAAKLDGFLKTNSFAPVSRVITMDPRSDGATPNPFCTLWPYLKSKENTVELFLVERDSSTDKSKGIMSLIKNEQDFATQGSLPPDIEKILSPKGGSTVVCWTGEGMRDADGILAKLCANFVGTVPDWAKGNPKRCADLAIFYTIPDGQKEMGVVERWYFHSGSDTGGFDYIKGSTLPVDAERKQPE
jgi:hypothetical protein